MKTMDWLGNVWAMAAFYLLLKEWPHSPDFYTCLLWAMVCWNLNMRSKLADRITKLEDRK